MPSQFVRQPTVIMVLTAIIIGSSAYPPTAHLYESSMMTHMLLQLPLLALTGWLIPLQHSQAGKLFRRYDPCGAIAVVALIGCSLFWMLPLNLDLAVSDPMFRALKLVSVPIGIGLCLKWTWLHAHAIVRIVVLFELWASLTRLGWLYLESPLQLCSNYLIGEQRTVGTWLLGISLLTGLYGLWVGFCGNHSDLPDRPIAKTTETR